MPRARNVAPGELELARERARRERAASSRGSERCTPTRPNSATMHAVAEDLLLGEVERVGKYGDERLGPVVVLGDVIRSKRSLKSETAPTMISKRQCCFDSK